MTAGSLLITIKNTIEPLLKMQKAFAALKKSNSLAQDISIAELVEKYFSYERLPSSMIKVTGKLAPYVPTTHFPVYSPLDLKNVEFKKTGDIFVDNSGQKFQPTQVTLNTVALPLPSLALNPINLDDGSSARVLWLYPVETSGILFRPNRDVKLRTEQLGSLFDIKLVDKPIPILVNKELHSDQFLYKTVTVVGNIITASKSQFDVVSNNFDPFTINFFSNCIRPFASHEGVLAIDARKPNGEIKVHDSSCSAFNMLYTVQGCVNIPNEIEEQLTSKVAISKFADAIPDRQGIHPYIKAIKDNGVNSVITIGDISWQYCEENGCFSASIPMNAADPISAQTKVTMLAHHWQSWQKLAKEQSIKLFHYESNINTIICTNQSQSPTFTAEGLQIPKSLYETLLSKNPNIRNGIDWLGVSVGRNL